MAFVRARIAEERADAEAATDRIWLAEADDNDDGDPVVTCDHEGYIRHVAEPSYHEDARHIARQNPAATLARRDALTALVDLCAERARERSYDDPYDVVGENVLGHIAAIWRDHADYRPEWSRQ